MKMLIIAENTLDDYMSAFDGGDETGGWSRRRRYFENDEI